MAPAISRNKHKGLLLYYRRLHNQANRPKKTLQENGVRFQRSFPGKTCDQISDGIDGIITDIEPTHVILHAGTNNLPAESADCCVTKIKNLALNTRKKFQNAKIGISSLTHREDINVSMKQSEVNKKLKEMAHRNSFDVIDNSHI